MPTFDTAPCVLDPVYAFKICVNGFYSLLVVVVVNADDDVRFIRGLCNHFDVYADSGKGSENSCADTAFAHHISADDGDERKLLFRSYFCAELFFYSCNYIVHIAAYGGTGNDNAYGVDARGDMLNVDLVILENFEYAAREADLRGHMILENIEGNEILFARNTRDYHAVVVAFALDYRAGA